MVCELRSCRSSRLPDCSFRLLVGGALVTETVFSWPGMGLLFVNALGTRDYPVLMAILMVGALVVVLGNLLADVIVALIDPRIKLGHV